MTFELSDLTRKRLVEDMLIRGYSDKTRSDYVRVAVDFTGFFGGPPEFAEAEIFGLTNCRWPSRAPHRPR